MTHKTLRHFDTSPHFDIPTFYTLNTSTTIRYLGMRDKGAWWTTTLQHFETSTTVWYLRMRDREAWWTTTLQHFDNIATLGGMVLGYTTLDKVYIFNKAGMLLMRPLQFAFARIREFFDHLLKQGLSILLRVDGCFDLLPSESENFLFTFRPSSFWMIDYFFIPSGVEALPCLSLSGFCLYFLIAL